MTTPAPQTTRAYCGFAGCSNEARLSIVLNGNRVNICKTCYEAYTVRPNPEQRKANSERILAMLGRR